MKYHMMSVSYMADRQNEATIGGGIRLLLIMRKQERKSHFLLSIFSVIHNLVAMNLYLDNSKKIRKMV
jgi:hypothetical protein